MGIVNASEGRQLNEWRAAMKRVVERDPNIDTSVFREFLNRAEEVKRAHDNDVQRIRGSAAANNIPVDPRMLAARSKAHSSRFMRNFHHRIMTSGTPEQKQAWSKLSNELQPESVLMPIVRQFWDTDKGGLQIGGVAGALAGLGMAYKMTDGFASQGLWSAVLAITLGGGMAMLANNLINHMGKGNSAPPFRAPETPYRSPGRNPEPAPYKNPPAQDVTPPIPPAATRPSYDVSDRDSGLLSAPDTIPSRPAGVKPDGLTP